MIVLLVLAALALAYANGANDNLKATATLYGAGAVDYEQSRRLATIAQILGSVASVVLAGVLLQAFRGKGLVPAEVVANPAFLVAVGTGAAATVLLATRVGLPISTTHALVGGLAGAGFAMAPAQLSISALGKSYFLPLLTSPLIATAAAGILYPIAHRSRRRLGIESDTCICIGDVREPVVPASDGSLVVRRTGLPVTIDELSACQQAYEGHLFGARAQTLVDRLHEASAFSLGFARGLNDTPKVMALLVAAGWAGADARISLVSVAVAMAIGGWLNARRVAETLAHGITTLTHGQGLLANAVASALVIGASLLGSPVSTTHVSTGALFGIGLSNDSTRWHAVGGIVAAWVVTLPVSALLAAGTVWLIAG